jgi:hypothetical protein
MYQIQNFKDKFLCLASIKNQTPPQSPKKNSLKKAKSVEKLEVYTFGL